MKKSIIVFLLSALIVTGNAQLKRETISELKIGTVFCRYGKAIDLEKGDTTLYIYLDFQNEKYSSIKDIVTIVLLVGKDSSEVYDFSKDLQTALVEMGNKSTINWSRDNYSISIYDSSNSLYLYEPKSNGTGYTLLSKKQVEKLINWLESVGYKMRGN